MCGNSLVNSSSGLYLNILTRPQIAYSKTSVDQLICQSSQQNGRETANRHSSGSIDGNGCQPVSSASFKTAAQQ
jgi:hypothetical protein